MEKSLLDPDEALCKGSVFLFYFFTSSPSQICCSFHFLQLYHYYIIIITLVNDELIFTGFCGINFILFYSLQQPFKIGIIQV